MSMVFQQVKTAVRQTLAAAAQANRFTVIGFQKPKVDADTIGEFQREVRVFYRSGDFGGGSSSNTGIGQHDMTFQLDLIVSAAAQVDLATLDDPNATVQQKMSALGQMTAAEDHADALLDDFWQVVWNILQDPVNEDFGLPVGIVAGTPGKVRVTNFEKSEPSPQGQTVILVGTATLALRVAETPVGDTSNVAIHELDNYLPVTANPNDTAPDSVTSPAAVTVKQ